MRLHVIVFNVPFPADYGGVIGAFYHIKALHDLGVELILHCFTYGRSPSKELEALAIETNYYPRNTSWVKQFSLRPYIVTSRQDGRLVERLKKDDYPVLFEGTHACALLGHSALAERTKMVRMHNVEWQYYHNLVDLESVWWKKAFYAIEAWKLKRFELQYVKKHADHVLAVSPEETRYFEKEGFPSVHYVSAFHANERVVSLTGNGKYVLFQGDLSVKENEKAAIYILEEIFNDLTDIPLKIVGREASDSLRSIIQKYTHVTLESDVSEERFDELIRNAHVNLLIAFQPAGMKLKLLNALYRGRWCLVNSPMVVNTGIAELCQLEDDPLKLKQSVRSLMNRPFPEGEINRREIGLGETFSNIAKARITVDLLK